jgi:hypothetical protein
MIVYASGKVLGTDGDGDTQEITAQGPESDELKVSDNEARDYLHSIIKELRILNLHMSLMTDQHINRQDVEV